MPHLVQMDKRYKKKGLTIIGDEVQGSDDDAIEEVAKDARIEFPITKGSTRPAGMQGIPHAVVFDPTGNLVFAGHPADDEFERSIKKALKDVKLDGAADDDGDDPAPAASTVLIESRTWTNEAGKKIVASVLAIKGDKVTFKLSNGKSVDYPIAQLSEDDQTVIKEAGEKSTTEE